QPQDPAGEWWELFDDVHNLPYYHNTKTGQTEWERPQDSSNIISLTAIQASVPKCCNIIDLKGPAFRRKSVIGQRLSLHFAGGAASNIQDHATAIRKNVEKLRIGPLAARAAGERPVNDLQRPPSPHKRPTTPNRSPVTSNASKTEEQTSPSPISPSKSPRNALSSILFQRTAISEAISGPELTPPTSPTNLPGLMDLSSWRTKGQKQQQQPSKASQEEQPLQGGCLPTSSIMSSFQKAASMTLNRHTMATSSQPIQIPTSSKPRPAIPTNSPPGAPKFNTVGPSGDSFLQPARKSFQIAERARKFGIGAPIANDEAARQMSPMIIEQQQEALRKMSTSPPSSSSKWLFGKGQDDYQQPLLLPEPQQQQQLSSTGSTPKPGPRPALPAELQSSISQFRIAGFAQKYFTTHKKGLFRRKVPMEKMLLHQKASLTQPLMVLNKRGVQKDALRCFKIIQKLMGERKGQGYVGPTGVELGETCVDLSIQSEEDIKVVLELIKKGQDHGELRDEIYVQLCKQLTENPSREGSIKGWHLFTVLLITFSPSKNLHEYLASFLNQHATSSLHPIPVMAQHCLDLLRRISKRGSRAKLLTLVEIARAQEAAFRPSVFEATLDRLMGRQMAEGGEWAAWRVPRLMVFLKECVVNLGGLTTEGIFRVSGDLGAVSELRARIELGNYDLSGISDPNVPCSLLRLWIRDLPEPIIPYDMYHQCIQGAQDKEEVAKVVNSLPMWHKETIVYLVSFLKTFNDSKVREATKMSLSNLAMVFAPTLLQCSNEEIPTLMGHLQAERTFVSTLISEVELSEEDLRMVGEVASEC
ncbi:hypothetical protein BGW38_006958, partial [Lunasporangiospora selenospora]